MLSLIRGMLWQAVDLVLSFAEVHVVQRPGRGSPPRGRSVTNQVSADRMATTLRESYVMEDDAVVY
jgi:hypothetical protein